MYVCVCVCACVCVCVCVCVTSICECYILTPLCLPFPAYALHPQVALSSKYEETIAQLKSDHAAKAQRYSQTFETQLKNQISMAEVTQLGIVEQHQVDKSYQAKDFERRLALAISKGEELVEENTRETNKTIQKLEQEQHDALRALKEEHDKEVNLLQLESNKKLTNLEKLHAHALAEQAEEALSELTLARSNAERSLKRLQNDHEKECKLLEADTFKALKTCKEASEQSEISLKLTFQEHLDEQDKQIRELRKQQRQVRIRSRCACVFVCVCLRMQVCIYTLVCLCELW